MSEVNTYRVIDFIMQFLPEPVGDSMVLAQRHLNELVAAYDALAPDWSNAPENAVWCAIHANGLQYWFDAEPVTTDGYNGWHNKSAWNDFYRETNLPIGIDWRICKWQRPEVTK